jgi:hypothetical protein
MTWGIKEMRVRVFCPLRAVWSVIIIVNSFVASPPAWLHEHWLSCFVFLNKKIHGLTASGVTQCRNQQTEILPGFQGEDRP